MTPDFVSVDSFCKLSGLGRTTVYYRLADGSLRAVKAGRRTLIDYKHAQAWLAARPTATFGLKVPQ